MNTPVEGRPDAPVESAPADTPTAAGRPDSLTDRVRRPRNTAIAALRGLPLIRRGQGVAAAAATSTAPGARVEPEVRLEVARIGVAVEVLAEAARIAGAGEGHATDAAALAARRAGLVVEEAEV